MKDKKLLLDEDGLTEEEFLDAYNPGDWEKASMTTDIANFTVSKNEKGVDQLKILLIKRGNHPDIFSWALPGGFMDMTESLHDAASRELSEETSLNDVYLRPVGEFSNPNRDKRMRVVTFAYMSLIEQSQAKGIYAGDDAIDAKWFTIRRKVVNQLGDNVQLSIVLENKEENIVIEYLVMETFVKNGKIKEKKYKYKHVNSSSDYLMADHIDIIDTTLRKLRTEIEYLPIAFNLLKDEFTVTEAQSVYEAIWGRNLEEGHPDFNSFTKSLDQSNFTRMIKKYILDTGKTKSHNKSGPAPKLYTLKNDY